MVLVEVGGELDNDVVGDAVGELQKFWYFLEEFQNSRALFSRARSMKICIFSVTGISCELFVKVDRLIFA